MLLKKGRERDSDILTRKRDVDRKIPLKNFEIFSPGFVFDFTATDQEDFKSLNFLRFKLLKKGRERDSDILTIKRYVHRSH